MIAIVCDSAAQDTYKWINRIYIVISILQVFHGEKYVKMWYFTAFNYISESEKCRICMTYPDFTFYWQLQLITNKTQKDFHNYLYFWIIYSHFSKNTKMYQILMLDRLATVSSKAYNFIKNKRISIKFGLHHHYTSHFPFKLHLRNYQAQLCTIRSHSPN